MTANLTLHARYRGAVTPCPPELVKERVVNMVLNEEIVSRNGKPLKVRLDTLCVHGDEPSGVIVARAARQGLEAAGGADCAIARDDPRG